MTSTTLAAKPHSSEMAPGVVVYTYFMAIMVDEHGKHWLDQTLTYREPTGAFTTPVGQTHTGLIVVLTQDERSQLIRAPRNASAVEITRIVSTTQELNSLLTVPDFGADEVTRTERAFCEMMARLTAANPTSHKE